MDHTDLLNSNNSQKQKMRDERKKILKICINKLQMIQDPESYLCKSVLINNTLKSIQQEHRELQRSRIRLKRQKKTFCDELENKKLCLEDLTDKKEEFDLRENDLINDVISHQNMANDIITHQDDSYNDVILLKNTSKSTHVDDWSDEGDYESCDSQDKTRTVDISIKSVDYSKENSSDTDINFCNDNFTSISYTQKFSESLIHSNIIPLQT